MARCIGCFEVSRTIIEDHPEWIALILDHCRVLTKTALYERDVVRYTVESLEFDIVSDDDPPPLYHCILTQKPEEPLSLHFERVF